MSIEMEAFKKRQAITKKDSFTFNEWSITSSKGVIMGSCCERSPKCNPKNVEDLCNFCHFEDEVNIPSLPDMVFANNSLVLEHENGGRIEFNALEALKHIGECPNELEVACAKEWRAARADCEFMKNCVRDYDWTYSTLYEGTVTGSKLSIVPTDDKIDLNKLRVKEDILFYQEVYLYEDELDDNGCTRCVVKVRVMPSGFLVVMRHYLRVDHTIIRIHDTRLYCSKGSDHIIKETSIREAPFSEITDEPSVYKNPDLIWEKLSIKEEKTVIVIPIM